MRDVLNISKRGVLFPFIGLAILAFGVLLVLFGTGTIEVHDPEAPTRVIFVIGMLMFVGGLGLACRTAGVQLNGRTGLIIDWWGIVVPIGRREYALKDFDTVQVIFEPFSSETVRNGGGKTLMVFKVMLKGVEEQRPVTLMISGSQSKTLAMAKKVAGLFEKRLQCPHEP